MRAAAFACLALVASQAQAQTYKCVDAQNRVTYSNTSCEKQGLKDAGPVQDRLMTVPATEVQKLPRKEPAKASPEPDKKSAK